MSVLIKGFEMPTHCKDCVLEEDGYCFLINDVVEPLGRPRSCPFVEVPAPHGRLIDADRLIKQAGQYWDEHGVGFYGVGTGNILRAPTVIEGEE